ncbi:MAG TPA: hypothetical protein VKN99_00715 [Polyangia bacterium]|nr:hypothetical protein [Polyangia bacterium]
MLEAAGLVPAKLSLGLALADGEARASSRWSKASLLHGVGERSEAMSHTRFGSSGYFSHERLAAYDFALAALEFVAARKPRLSGLSGGIGQQLERAVAGAYTNLCAGASAFGAESRRHFKLALSEAGEAGGAARGVYALGALAEAEHAELRAALLRLCACLRGLAQV